MIVVRRCAQLIGMGFVFAPVNTAAYAYLPEDQHSNATGLFNVFRNEGASLGIALVSIVLAQRGQLHQSRLVEGLTVLDPAFVEARGSLVQQFQQSGYDAVTSQSMALQQIYQAAQQQAAVLSYLDLFWMFSVMALCLAPLVFLMRRSVAESGNPIHAH